MSDSLNNLDARLSRLTGTVQGLAEVTTAVIRSLPPASALMTLDALETSRRIALEEDDITGTPPEESRERESILQAYCGLLGAVARSRG